MASGGLAEHQGESHAVGSGWQGGSRFDQQDKRAVKYSCTDAAHAIYRVCALGGGDGRFLVIGSP
jgi:hypothetical protein